ncbi:MAG: ABC transporter permease [Gemmatimonadota bacterium]
MPSPEPRPPRLLVLLAGLLLSGDEGRLIRAELEESYVRDLQKRMPLRVARGRYARNLLGSIWSVWTARLPRTLARGLTLDAKLGLRMLAKQPLLTPVAMLALGLGIPASLALHHGLGVLFSPLPVPEGERLLGIRNHSLETHDPVLSSVHDYARWREALDAFEQVAAARAYRVNLYAGEPGAPPLRGAEMSASAFGLLRATPLMGRMLVPADEIPGAPDVVLLGQDVWRSRFAGDPAIVGRTVRVGRTEHTVVGVMPSSFRFPVDEDVWLPLRASPLDHAEGEGPDLWVFGRLRDGVTAERAALEVAQMTERLAIDDPDRYARWIGQVVPMPLLLMGVDEFLRSDPDFLTMQSTMLLLLLILCGNVGTLLLARNTTRMGELAIRTALGASRARIVIQLFIEALVLALVATGLGLIAAEAAIQWVFGNELAPLGVPYWLDPGLRTDTVLLALTLSVLAAVVAGVLPAFRATGRDVHATLQHWAAGRASVRFGLGSSLLIVSEIVLSVGFITLAGAMVRNVLHDSTAALGLEPDRYLRADVRVPANDATPDPEDPETEAVRVRLARTQQEVLRRLAEDEAVRGVGMGDDLANYEPGRRSIVLEGSESDGEPQDAAALRVDVGFFRGLGRPILAGRDFSAADLEALEGDGPAPVIVNTPFVDHVVGGRNAIGQRFRPRSAARDAPWFEIVGVVGPFGTNPINPDEAAAWYEPAVPGTSNPARYLVEVAGDPAAFAPRLREIVAAVDPEATVDQAIALGASWEADRSIWRWLSVLPLVLSGVAFLLAVSGLYALMSFTVSQRTREVAIRSALGARPWSIVATIARRAALQLGIGLALGGVWAWALLRQEADEAFVQSISIPLTVAATLVVTALVGVVACASPTLRGLRIQPSEALREG